MKAVSLCLRWLTFFRQKFALVFRHAGVNIVRPGGDAALEVDEATFEAGARQRLDGAGAADAALAVHDRLALLFNLVLPVDDLAERDQFRAGDARDLVLVRLAHIYDLQVVAAVEALFQLQGGDLFHLTGLLRLVRRRSLSRRGPESAELFVVNQALERRVLAADGARRVFPELQLAEAKVPRVEPKQAVDERLGPAEDELDGLVRLNRADDAGQKAEDSALRATRHASDGRRLRIQTAVARTFRRPEDARLPLEAEDRAIDVRLAREHAGVVDEVARREVVRAVHDHVVVAKQLQRVLARQARLVSFDLHVRVDVVQPVARRLDLRSAHVLRAVDDLPLQVRRVHHVEVHDAERADARRRQVHPRRRSQPPRPDHQHARGLQTPLPLHADLRHDEVSAVARDLFVRECRERGGFRLHRRTPLHFLFGRRAAGNRRYD